MRCADEFEGDEVLRAPVHVRKQQRNGRKSVTTIQGLPYAVDLVAVLKALRRELCANGCVVHSATHGDVLQLQGDHRAAVRAFLVAHRLADADRVFVHGD